MCFELDADTEIETRDYGTMTVAELERLMRARGARANAPATLRCSGSFHDPTRVRTDSHLINWGRYGLGIYDTMTETTWHRRERAPSARCSNFGAIARRSRPMTRMDEPDAFDGDAISRADREFLASLDDHPLGATPAVRDAMPAAARLRAVRSERHGQTAARLAFFAERRRLDAGELRLSRRRLHGQGRRHLAGRRRDHLTSPTCAGAWQPWALLHSGPRGGLKMRSPVEDWMTGEGPALDPSRGDAPRPAAADLHGRRLCDLQPLPAAGAPGERRRSRGVREPSSRGSSPTRRNGHGCGTGSPTRRAGRGCRWSR